MTILRTVLTAVFLLASTVVGSAQTSDIITPDELREAAYARQVDRIEKGLEIAQAAFEQGEVTAGDMRELVRVFNSTHPDILSFNEHWVAARPNSAFAHAAQALSLYDVGFMLRGEQLAKDTYPDALRAFSDLHAQAWQHATTAYEIDPRFIPASDAVIILGNTTYNRLRSFEVLAEVMEIDPNFGSVRNGLSLSAKGWGGSFAQAMRICETFAPRVEMAADPVDICKLRIWEDHYQEELFDWAIDFLSDNEDEHYAYFRMRLIFSTRKPISLDDGLFAEDYLSLDDVVWPKVAHTYDHLMARRYGLSYLHEVHFHKAHERAQKLMEHDPYDPELIATRLTKLIGGGFHLDGDGRPYDSSTSMISKEENRDFRLRLIQVQPYHAQHWANFANYLRRQLTYESDRDSEQFLINAIVYSRHDVIDTQNLLMTKLKQLNFVENAVHGVDYTFEKFTPAETDKDVLCPLIRIYRVHDHLCLQADEDEKSHCSLPIETRTMITQARKDATDRNVCRWERNTPPEKMKYLPVNVNFNRLTGG